MAEMEEPSQRCGKFCWRWKDSMGKQQKKIKEPWPWSWTWQRPSSGSVFLCLGLGNALQLPKEDLASAVRVLRAPEACTVGRTCGRAAHDHHGHPAGVEVELLALTGCGAGCVQ